jgi:hypothetical protein
MDRRRYSGHKVAGMPVTSSGFEHGISKSRPFHGAAFLAFTDHQVSIWDLGLLCREGVVFPGPCQSLRFAVLSDLPIKRLMRATRKGKSELAARVESLPNSLILNRLHSAKAPDRRGNTRRSGEPYLAVSEFRPCSRARLLCARGREPWKLRPTAQEALLTLNLLSSCRVGDFNVGSIASFWFLSGPWRTR